MMNISIDSRLVSHPESTVFFAFKGKNSDGHDYVKDLYDKGVRVFVVSERREEYLNMKDADIRYVSDVLDALQDYAGKYRRQMNAEVIAVTGSNGKTIVKEWLYQLLADDFVVFRSPKSYNSQLGVPLSLNGMEQDTRLAIIEAGISERGEMERLERMIHPDVAVFTHFGDAHSENFKDEDEKLAEKAVLFRRAKVIVGKASKETDYILSVARKDVRKVMWGKGNGVEVKIEAEKLQSGSRQVSLLFQGTAFVLNIPFPDEASFENCMNAVCVMLYKGIAPDIIAKRISQLQPVAMRLEIKEGVNNSILISDYYNSDITSFQLALNALMMQDELKKRVVILSDFVNLKSDPQVLYKQVAQMLNMAKVDLFIGIGEELYRQREIFSNRVRLYQTTDDFLKNEVRDDFANQVVLIKGARKFCFEYIQSFLQQRTHHTLLEVDLDAMLHNLNYFKSLLPEKTKVAVMLKAFSYGAGSGEVANWLQYHKVDYFMVAFADEGIALRADGVTTPIAVMNPEPDVFDSMIEFNLEPEIFSLEMLKVFDKTLQKYGVEDYPIHIKINTGMNRSGFDPSDIAGLMDYIQGRKSVRIQSIFSHLAAADEQEHDPFTVGQLELFQQISEEIQRCFDYRVMRHILNSGGIERFGAYAMDMVRLGIGLHGISVNDVSLMPVSTFKTYVMSIRDVKSSETVGYGRKGLVHKNSRIAVVPVGYADGLNRKLSNGIGKMFIKGKLVPIIGNICMDTCMLDITDTDIQVGDEVEIFGKNIPVTSIASALETIPYEILTAIAYRVKRVYVKE